MAVTVAFYLDDSEAGEPTNFQGTANQLYKKGRAIIFGTQFPLEFRTSQKQVQKICGMTSPTIAILGDQANMCNET